METAYVDPTVPTTSGYPPVEGLEVDEPVDSIEAAIEKVLGRAAAEGGSKIGISQVIKAIEAGVAHFVFLAEDLDETAMSQIVRLLAAQNNVPVISVPEKQKLGQWAGLYKVDKDGEFRKVRSASCVALIHHNRKTQALAFIESHVKGGAN